MSTVTEETERGDVWECCGDCDWVCCFGEHCGGNLTGLSAGEWTVEDFESGDFETLKEEGDRAAAEGGRDIAEMPRAVAAGAGDVVGVGLESEGEEDSGSDFVAAAAAECLIAASFASPSLSLAL